LKLSNEVYLGHCSRGDFAGDIQILSDFRLDAWDYLGLTAFLLQGASPCG